MLGQKRGKVLRSAGIVGIGSLCRARGSMGRTIAGMAVKDYNQDLFIPAFLGSDIAIDLPVPPHLLP
ncbi:hypothetical protein Pcinc_021582 [Petrolisthes cinctipes]|uniref:Uncharacterized protein n=1 Tax=Petrolisthes cinctipes TaxID=88211 RepID=A0AAE1FGQ7_PETCI|nr:hypothetical protein Pcinc_021582 [Petrolisthes cinctipes]